MFLLSVNSGEKLVAEVYELIILSREIPLASHKFILLAFLVHFALQLFDINTKWSCNSFEEKRFSPLRIPYLFIRSVVNPFVDIVLTSFSSSSKSFSSFLFFALFEVIFLLNLISLLSKSVFLQNQWYQEYQLLNLLVLILQQDFLMLIY